MTGILVTGSLVLGTIVVVIFVRVSPQFGGKMTEELRSSYEVSEQWDGDKFNNISPTSLDMPLRTMIRVIAKQFEKIPNRRPSKEVEIVESDLAIVVERPRLTWFGHSTFLVELNGRNILIDPMFGDVPAPLPFLGQSRYSGSLPINVEDLPPIDAVILSHDHYDHLDYGSIIKLREKVNQYFVPMGVGRHLMRWGISADRIIELDWWEDASLHDIKLILTPARHFSGRSFGDRTTTLWGSWVIQSDSTRIFFSGDSGYDEHFNEIGEKYGPFDFAMLECGQYFEAWKPIHMTPEQMVQAALDVKAEVAMPIHWGAFSLAFHTWTEPVERASAEAVRLGVNLCTPMIGEPIIIGANYPNSTWWKQY